MNFNLFITPVFFLYEDCSHDDRLQWLKLHTHKSEDITVMLSVSPLFLMFILVKKTVHPFKHY